jgi:hypothetical protein
LLGREGRRGAAVVCASFFVAPNPARRVTTVPPETRWHTALRTEFAPDVWLAASLESLPSGTGCFAPARGGAT